MSNAVEYALARNRQVMVITQPYRQGSLREKARANKGKNPLSGKTTAFDEFERISGKVEAVEAEAVTQ